MRSCQKQHLRSTKEDFVELGILFETFRPDTVHFSSITVGKIKKIPTKLTFWLKILKLDAWNEQNDWIRPIVEWTQVQV